MKEFAMINPVHPFQDVLDAADRLSLDEQQTLLNILQRRVAQRERLRLADDIAEARQQFQSGQCGVSPIESIMDEVDREP